METKTLTAGRYTITLKSELSYWDTEEIKSLWAESLDMRVKGGDANIGGLKGSVILKVKQKTFELSIVEIKEADKAIPFSFEWLKGLTEEEGNLIFQAIEDSKKK